MQSHLKFAYEVPNWKMPSQTKPRTALKIIVYRWNTEQRIV
jgi:hypothetical protein